MCKTWPFLDDLLLATEEHPLPPALVEQLRRRYDEHGGEYATPNIHEPTGAPINACMTLNTLDELEEELVDSIFNALVLVFRSERGVGTHLLYRLVDCWALAKALA